MGSTTRTVNFSGAVCSGAVSYTHLDVYKRQGFGIGNVKDILEKYHAEYLFTYDDGRFIFSADWPDVSESPVNTSILS